MHTETDFHFLTMFLKLGPTFDVMVRLMVMFIRFVKDCHSNIVMHVVGET